MPCYQNDFLYLLPFWIEHSLLNFRIQNEVVMGFPNHPGARERDTHLQHRQVSLNNEKMQ